MTFHVHTDQKERMIVRYGWGHSRGWGCLTIDKEGEGCRWTLLPPDKAIDMIKEEELPEQRMEREPDPAVYW